MGLLAQNSGLLPQNTFRVDRESLFHIHLPQEGAAKGSKRWELENGTCEQAAVSYGELFKGSESN